MPQLLLKALITPSTPSLNEALNGTCALRRVKLLHNLKCKIKVSFTQREYRKRQIVLRLVADSTGWM